ncbi:uncharacterized protein LOC129587659 isoform X2 [Paramacrobiotus metropolitanus]|nr:uncharacterized protein LOC129587659 isoform X2 [Paramacrobiotus metropolitanus]
MVRCCIVGCNNNSDRKDCTTVGPHSFHKFPKVTLLRDRWLRSINRLDFQPSVHSAVCSDHFEANCFSASTAKNSLKQGCIPTLFGDAVSRKYERKADSVASNTATSAENQSAPTPFKVGQHPDSVLKLRTVLEVNPFQYPGCTTKRAEAWKRAVELVYKNSNIVCREDSLRQLTRRCIAEYECRLKGNVLCSPDDLILDEVARELYLLSQKHADINTADGNRKRKNISSEDDEDSIGALSDFLEASDGESVDEADKTPKFGRKHKPGTLEKLRIVLDVNPFQFPRGSKETGAAWKKAAELAETEYQLVSSGDAIKILANRCIAEYTMLLKARNADLENPPLTADFSPAEVVARQLYLLSRARTSTTDNTDGGRRKRTELSTDDDADSVSILSESGAVAPCSSSKLAKTGEEVMQCGNSEEYGGENGLPSSDGTTTDWRYGKFWCSECLVLLDTPCLIHRVLCADAPFIPRAYASLPHNLRLDLGKHDTGPKRIVAKGDIEPQSIFGPLYAPRRKAVQKDFKYATVMRDVNGNEIMWYFNLECDDTSNWMKFVRMADTVAEQNLAAYWADGEVYFAAIRKIQPGEELKVWYSTSYAALIGKDMLGTGEMRCQNRALLPLINSD